MVSVTPPHPVTNYFTLTAPHGLCYSLKTETQGETTDPIHTLRSPDYKHQGHKCPPSSTPTLQWNLRRKPSPLNTNPLWIKYLTISRGNQIKSHEWFFQSVLRFFLFSRALNWGQVWAQLCDKSRKMSRYRCKSWISIFFKKKKSGPHAHAQGLSTPAKSKHQNMTLTLMDLSHQLGSG